MTKSQDERQLLTDWFNRLGETKKPSSFIRGLQDAIEHKEYQLQKAENA